MNKILVWKKLLLPSVLIGLFFIALTPSLTFAQDSKSTSNDLARAIYMRDYANNAELNQVADQIFLEKVTPEFTATLYATLYDFQKDIITKKLAELTGASFSELLA